MTMFGIQGVKNLPLKLVPPVSFYLNVLTGHFKLHLWFPITFILDSIAIDREVLHKVAAFRQKPQLTGGNADLYHGLFAI